MGMNEEVRKVTLKSVVIRVENKVGRVIGTLRISPRRRGWQRLKCHSQQSKDPAKDLTSFGRKKRSKP